MTTGPLDITVTPFTMPADARVLAVSDLAPRLRTRIGPVSGGQSVITRPGFRVTTRLVPEPLVHLLSEFKGPSLISDAVLRFSRAHDVDPLDTMDLAFDGLATLVQARILVPADSPDASAATPTLAAGQAFAGFEIDELVRSLEDSEVYRAHNADDTAVALKIARADRPRVAAMLAYEASVLAHLDGLDSPRLLAEGACEGRAYLALEWCDGVSVAVAAQRARASRDRRRLQDLVSRVVKAYGRLHDRSVLHGDVHPGNCLVRDDGRVVLLDYGNARTIAPQSEVHGDPERTGVPQFYDPQLAAALLAEQVPVAVDPKAEQYAVAVLAYLLLTGLHPIELPADQQELLRRIAERPMLPFTARGVPAWPDVEAALRQAMAPDPGHRFSDVAAFADALSCASVPQARRLLALAPHADLRASIDSAHSRTRAPECVRSTPSNSAEQAWLAWRAALALDDAALMATADVLSAQAGGGWATQSVVVHLARGRSDARSERAAIGAFLAAVTPLREGSQRQGALVAAARLLDGVRQPSPESEALARWTTDHVHALLPPLDSKQREGVDPLAAYLTLSLAKSGVAAARSDLSELLERIAAAQLGDLWLWALAYELFADPRYLTRALDAKLTKTPLPRAFGLLRRYQLTGDSKWVEEATRIAGTVHLACTAWSSRALLVAELAAPESAYPPPWVRWCAPTSIKRDGH